MTEIRCTLPGCNRPVESQIHEAGNADIYFGYVVVDQYGVLRFNDEKQHITGHKFRSRPKLPGVTYE